MDRRHQNPVFQFHISNFDRRQQSGEFHSPQSNLGLRFSKKALIASFWSEVPQQ